MAVPETIPTPVDGAAEAPAAEAAGPPEGATAATPVLRLRRLQEATITLPVEGITPLIPHQWSEKALQLMRDKQFTSAAGTRPPRVPKDPQEEAQAATYWCPDGRPGMPAVAFKAAMVGACRFFEGISMTSAKAMFFVLGEGPEQLVPIDGQLQLFEATPRNQGGVVDLRYRNKIYPWSATIIVRFLSSQVDAQSVLALLDAAGRLGVGDWRPNAPKSHTGTFGQWRVVDPEGATR